VLAGLFQFTDSVVSFACIINNQLFINISRGSAFLFITENSPTPQLTGLRDQEKEG
jgi:hypothetical protein